MIGNGIPVLHAVTDSLSTLLMRGQLSYLKANGFDPILLSSPGKEIEQIRARQDHRVFTVPMRREISPARDLKSLFDIWRLLRRIRPVVCNCGTPKAGLLVGLAAWLTRVPCRIYTLRGLRLETATGLKRIILMVTERIACACAHRVVCVSPSLRERAIALNLLPRHKAQLLASGSSNGVDPDRFAPTPERIERAAVLRRQLSICPGQPVIGFSGRFTHDKGLPELVAAFRIIQQRMPDALLLLVGGYEEGDPIPRQTREIIDHEPGIRRIEFTPQIELYYLVMNIFVLPTHREGFPNTVLEAQAAGLPVVTTFATGAVDAIDDGLTGLLVPAGDAEKLAEAILSLLCDPIEMRHMGRAGRERVLREFRNETVWEALSCFYKEILRERGYLFHADSSMETVRCVQSR